MAYCPWCGAEIRPQYRVCPKCARPLAGPYGSASSNSPTLLAIGVVAVALVAALALLAWANPPQGRLGDGNYPKPAVTLTASKTSTGVDILVAGIQPTAAPSNFKVNIEDVGTSTFGTAVSMPTSLGGIVTVTVGTAPSSTQFGVQWENPGGSGQVSQGDVFVITAQGAYSAGTTYAFLLIWSDGSTLVSISWTV